MEAANDGRNLLDFKYACLGYSVFMDDKDNKIEKGDQPTELPFCAGLEVVFFFRLYTALNNIVL